MSDAITRPKQEPTQKGPSSQQVSWLEATFGLKLGAGASDFAPGSIARGDTPTTGPTAPPQTDGSTTPPSSPLPPTPPPTPPPIAATPPGGAKTPSPEFTAKADAIQAKIAALEAHAQHAHVATEIATAKAKLQEARNKAGAGDEPGAQPLLQAAEKAADDGKGFADRYAAFVVVVANATRTVNGLKVVNIDDGAKTVSNNIKAAETTIQAAQNKAKPPGRKYGEAEADIANALTPLTTQMKTWFVTATKAQIAQLKTRQTTLAGNKLPEEAGTVIDKDITDAEAFQASADADVTAQKWAQVVMDGRQVYDAVTTATKVADRRDAYDAQRKATMVEFNKIKDNPVLAAQIAGVRASLQAADAMATRAAMRFEGGISALKQVMQTCKDLAGTAADAEAYRRERAAADHGLAQLRNEKLPKEFDKRIASILAWLNSANRAVGSSDVVR